MRRATPWEERRERVALGVMGVDNVKHAFGEIHPGPELGWGVLQKPAEMRSSENRVKREKGQKQIPGGLPRARKWGEEGQERNSKGDRRTRVCWAMQINVEICPQREGEQPPNLPRDQIELGNCKPLNCLAAEGAEGAQWRRGGECVQWPAQSFAIC